MRRQWWRHRQRPRRDCPLRPFQFPNFAWLIGDHLQIQGTRTLPRYKTHWWRICQSQSMNHENTFESFWILNSQNVPPFSKEVNIIVWRYYLEWLKPRTDTPLAICCRQIKIGDLFVLNTYNRKICIKIIGFSREVDWNLLQQHFSFEIQSK